MLTAALLLAASPSRAQTAPDPNTGALTVTAGVDGGNAYYFRGILQDNTGVILWPTLDLGVRFASGDGFIRSLGANVGLWNSLHTGDYGLDGPTAELWYESDFYTALAAGFPGGATASLTYTAYTYPSGWYGNVQELSLRIGVDDSAWLGRYSVFPYLTVARELKGQADAGRNEGTYLEIGIAPGLSIRSVNLALPLKAGFSLGDYYEGAAGDDRFGFFSAALTGNMPLTAQPTRFGTLTLRGTVEFLKFGDLARERALNDRAYVASLGVGLSY